MHDFGQQVGGHKNRQARGFTRVSQSVSPKRPLLKSPTLEYTGEPKLTGRSSRNEEAPPDMEEYEFFNINSDW